MKPDKSRRLNNENTQFEWVAKRLEYMRTAHSFCVNEKIAHILSI